MDKAELFTDGEAYERMMGRWSRLVGETFLDWLDLPKGSRCLDIGCGNGAFTEEIIARCAPATVMAIDPSNEQLAFARTRPGAKMAEFELGDAQSLSFGDGTFDVAIMALVLAFLLDPAKAITEMARVIRPGGWVATYMWDIQNGGAPTTPIYTAINRWARRFRFDPTRQRRDWKPCAASGKWPGLRLSRHASSAFL